MSIKKKVTQTLILFTIDFLCLTIIYWQIFAVGFPAVADMGYPGTTIGLVLMGIIATVGITAHFLDWTHRT